MKKPESGPILFIAALALSSLVVAPSPSSAAAKESVDPPGEIDSTLAPTVNDRLFQTVEALEAAGVVGVNAPYAGLVIQTELTDNDTFDIRYFADAPEAQKLEEAIKIASASAQLKITATPTSTDPVKMNELALSLSYGKHPWLESVGISEVSGVSVDTRTDEILISIPGEAPIEPAEIDGHRVTVEGDARYNLNSRNNDTEPWSGGATLRTSSNGPVECTAGFNWVKWSNGEIMGSTAEHCYNAYSVPWRYNGVTAWGQRWYYHTMTDTYLARSNITANKYSPNVFVGGTNTSTIRRVVGAMATAPVGSAVALSGRASGLNAGKIGPSYSYFAGLGPMQQVLSNPYCTQGDSGGPWLATNSAGHAIAYGQHVGNRTVGSITVSCWYSPVTNISSALQATLYTY